MNRLLFFFGTAFLLLASACPVRDTSPVLFPPEIRSYLSYDPFTLWVYEDVQSGSLDSVFVTQGNFGNQMVQDIYDRDARERLSEVLEMTFHHSNLFGQGTQYTQVYATAMQGLKNPLIRWMGSAFVANPEWASLGYSHDTTFATYEVGGSNYPNVIQITDSADQNFGGALSHNYFAPGFALVRKEIPSLGSSWDLKEAHIRK